MLLLVSANHSLFPYDYPMLLSSCPIQVQRENFCYASNAHLAAVQIPSALLKISVIAVLL